MALDINKPFWERGEFPQVIMNGSEYIALRNPWVNGSPSAPFDKRTYSLLASPDRRRLTRCWDSLLSNPERRRRWNERLVPGWFRREALGGWLA